MILRQGSLQSLNDGRPISTQRASEESESKLTEVTAADQKEAEKEDIDYLRKTVKGLELEFMRYASNAGDFVQE